MSGTPLPTGNPPWCLRNLVQVAGVRDAAEAQMLVAAGVRWLGIPLRLAVHRPDLSEAAAAALIRTLPGDVIPVVITYVASAAEALDLCRFTAARAIQLHGPIPVAEVARLRELASDLCILKSAVVRTSQVSEGDALLAASRVYEPYVDAFITDTFDPLTGACGATGKTHDWQVSRHLVRHLSRPLILAGGLTPENVRAAIRQVQPAGVDTHTGIEDAAGAKDPDRVRRFLAAARAGFSDVNILTE